jgi:hypothetical protein
MQFLSATLASRRMFCFSAAVRNEGYACSIPTPGVLGGVSLVPNVLVGNAFMKLQLL